MIIKKSILGTAGYLHYHSSRLVKALALPFVLFVLLDQAGFVVTSKPVVLVIAMVSFFIQAMVAIITHRIILLGSINPPNEAGEEGGGRMQWGSRESLFLMYMVGFPLLAAPVLALASVSRVFGIVGGLAVVWVICRCSLVFPALATGRDFSLADSWQMTRDYQLDMFVIVAVIPVIMLAVIALVSQIPNSSIIISILAALYVVLQVALLSVAYKQIVEATEA